MPINSTIGNTNFCPLSPALQPTHKSLFKSTNPLRFRPAAAKLKPCYRETGYNSSQLQTPITGSSRSITVSAFR